jgi:hypothetical protein
MNANATIYSSLYLLPDEVVTTSPAFAPRPTGLVVISVPLLKFFEFLTIPVIEPSLFCLNLPTIGMLSATGAAFLGAPPKENPPDAFLATGLAGSGVTIGLLGLAPPPNRLKVGLFFAVLGASTSTLGASFLGAPIPNENPPEAFLATGLAGSGVTTGLLGLAPPKRLKVGDFLAGAAGFSAGFLGADEMEMVPALTGRVPCGLTGCALTVFFGAENDPNPPIPATPPVLAGFLTGACF